MASIAPISGCHIQRGKLPGAFHTLLSMGFDIFLAVGLLLSIMFDLKLQNINHF